VLSAAIQKTEGLRAILQTSLKATIQQEVDNRVLLGKAVSTNTATIDAVRVSAETGDPFIEMKLVQQQQNAVRITMRHIPSLH